MSVKNAWFMVTPTRVSADPNDRTIINVRVYYRFNLVENVDIQALVTSSSQPDERPGAIALVQRRRVRPLENLERYQPRYLHVDATAGKNGCELTFTCTDASGTELALSATSAVGADEIADLLFRYRRALTEITVATPYARQLRGGTGQFRDSLRKLAQIGRQAWRVLFPVGNPALTAIGRALSATPLSVGATIQVSITSTAERFLFPWVVVYDRPFDYDKKTLPDVEGFWGFRYVIEQQFSTPDAVLPPDDDSSDRDSVKLAFMLWSKFANASAQVALMDGYRQNGKGIDIAGPVTAKQQFNDEIERADAEILYFYTHGHTRQPVTSITSGSQISTFLSTFEALPPEADGRQVFKELYDELAASRFTTDQSWIELTSGRILYDELADQPLQLPQRPVVLLNMCESAQMLPGFSESFPSLFLTAGARTVVGTECIMTIAFAHPFAKEVLDRIFSGMDVGDALLAARRYFVQNQNPLGLAYALFGSAKVGFPPPRLAPSPAEAVTSAPPEVPHD